MKRIVLLSFLVLLTFTAAVSQSLPASSPAYWVVETNAKETHYSIVRFYTADNLLVHEVKIDGVYININRSRHKKRLDQLLKSYNDRAVASLRRLKSKHSI